MAKDDVIKIIKDNPYLESSEIAMILNKKGYRTRGGEIWTSSEVIKFMVKETF